MTKQYKIPLLKDHHSHLSLYSSLSECPHLETVHTKAQLYALTASLPEDLVTVFLGWNSSRFDLNVEDESTLPPVVIVNLSLHGMFISDRAKDLLKGDYPEIIAGYKDPNWSEIHFFKLMKFLAVLNPMNREKVKRFYRMLESIGIYYLEDMLVTSGAFIDMLEGSEFIHRTAFWADLESFESFSPEMSSKIAGIKLFTDGALGVKTAFVSTGFKGGVQGKVIYADCQLKEQLIRAHRTGKAVSVHAIGDLAIEQLVDVTEELDAEGISFPLFRMEHCQFISESQAERAKSLGMVLSMQPNFSFDTRDYTDRLSPDFLAGNNPFRMLIDKVGFVPGEDLLFGSDGMPHGIEAALQAAFFPPNDNQRLSIDELIAGYCMPDMGSGSIEFSVDDIQCCINDIQIRVGP